MNNPGAHPEIGSILEDAITIHDDRALRSLDVNARLVRLTAGGAWIEGPVYLPREASVMFSDIPNDRALAWSEDNGMTVWRQPNDFSNGNTLDREGRTEVVAGLFEGRPLNSPNDVVVKSDGTIWFTDPPYGILSDDEGYKSPQEQAGCFVFRFDPSDGSLVIVSDAMDYPNGLAFSPDESRLYVSDTSATPKPGGNHHIVAFDVIAGRELSAPEVIYVMEPGLPDGLRVDEHGHIWTSAGDGVQLLDGDGGLLARVALPEKSSNCVFGGADGRQLFITDSSSLYRLDTKVVGAGVAAAVARGEYSS